jgi:hypothetical protein
MKAVILDMPDDPSDVPGWLELKLVGFDAVQITSELSVFSGAGEEPPGALHAAIGEHLNAVLSGGLSVLPPVTIRELLHRPGLLLQLREEVLLRGGSHWDRVAEQVPEVREEVERARARLTARSQGRIRIRRWVSILRHPALVSVATAATVLAMMRLTTHHEDRIHPGPRGFAGGEVSELSRWRWESEGSSLLERVEKQAREDTRTLGRSIDALYLSRLADTIKSLDGRGALSPGEMAGSVLELRLICSLLIQHPPSTVVKSTREVLVRIAHSTARDLDRILSELDAGGKVDELRDRFATTVAGFVNGLLEESSRLSH